MITQVMTLLPCPVGNGNDVDSSYCSDDESSTVNHVTVLDTASSMNLVEESKDTINHDNCEGIFHGQGCGTCDTRSPDVDDDGLLNSSSTGSDTDGEYDCDYECPTTSSNYLTNDKFSKAQMRPLRQTNILSCGSRCQKISCQSPLVPCVINGSGSSVYSPCPTSTSSSSRLPTKISPCPISGMETELTNVLQTLPGEFMYRGEGNSSLVMSLTEEGKVIRILKDGKKSSSFSSLKSEKNKPSYIDFNGKSGDENFNSSNVVVHELTTDIVVELGGKDDDDDSGKPVTNKEQGKIKERLIDIIDFNRHVMKRILNHCFLDEPQLIYLNKSQVEMIDQVANVCRPGHRLHKSIPLRDTFALLLPDYCSMQLLSTRSAASDVSSISSLKSCLVGPVISVEIKPKQGFLPSIESLPSYLTVKSSICRFCLKQFYKMKKGNIAGISNYCPLDLFSGCIERQSLALESLIETPQNNFRIFKNLKHAYGDGSSMTIDQSQEPMSGDRLTEVLRNFIITDKQENCLKTISGQANEGIERVFCHLLLKSLNHPFVDPLLDNVLNEIINIDNSTTCQLHLDHGSRCTKNDGCESKGHGINSLSVLGSVYSAQRLDSVDSHRALEMARYLNGRYPNFMEELKSERRRPSQIGSPERLPTESLEDFFFRKVWEYIVSLTAKDCSIMITMQRIRGDPFANKPCPLRGFTVIQDDFFKESYLVATSITDLDPKLPATFADLERKIREKDTLMVASYNESHTKQ